MKINCLIYLLPAILTVYMAVLSFGSPFPNGADIWFHMDVARAYYRGENGMVSQVVMDINGLPYPPLFHFLLAPFASSVDTAILAAKVLQVIFYPASILALMLLVRKYKDTKTAVLFGLTLTGTYFAFAQMQARPQSFEMLLYPLAFYALMEDKTKTFAATMAAMFYIHSPITIAFFLGFATYLFRRNKWDLKLWYTILAIAPILVHQATYMFSNLFFKRWIAVGDTGILPETLQFFANPLFWLINGLGITIIAFALVPCALAKWKTQDTFTQVMLYSFLGMLVIIPTWYQRTLTIAIVPLAYFTAAFISQQKNRHIQILLITCLIVQAVLFSMSPVWWMAKPNYFPKYW